MADITTIKVGNDPESSFNLYPVNEEFLKRADEPEDPITPDAVLENAKTTAGIGWTDTQGAHQINKKYIPSDRTKETYTIASASWASLASSTPYTHSATVTATHTIGANTIVELLNNQPVLFATYGFAIISVVGQVITIASVGAPAESVSLEVMFHG